MEKFCYGERSEKIEEIISLRNFFRLLADTNRLKILCFLTKKEQCVCQIFEALNLSQNLVSHHLAQLEKMAILKKRKKGVFVVYSVDQKILGKYKDLFNKIIKN